MTYITNDCLAAFIYNKLEAPYTSPLIGSLFESDAQYVKFCQNFDHYMKQLPVFGPPKLPVKLMGIENPPIMFLDDIEIHWPHERYVREVVEKWFRRKERMTKPMFIWSDEQMFEGYSEELRQQFKAIPGSKFLMVKDIPDFVPGSLDYNQLGDAIIGHKTPEVHFHA